MICLCVYLLIGPFTGQLKASLLKDETYHRHIVKELLKFYGENNVKYAAFKEALTENVLNASPLLQAIPANGVHEDNIQDQSYVPSAGVGRGVRKPTFSGPNLQFQYKDSQSMDPISTTISVGDVPRYTDGQQAESLLRMAASTNANAYIIKPSRVFMQRNDASWLSTAFAHLFPFGRGGLDEHRSTHISQREILNHYLRISSGQFLDWEFVLHSYDTRAQSDIFQGGCAQARMKYGNGSKGEAWAGMSRTQLNAAVTYTSSCNRAAKSGRPVPPAPPDLDPRGVSFCRSLTTSLAAAEHTTAHAQKARVKLYSMHHTFGKPSFWVTVTPGA